MQFQKHFHPIEYIQRPEFSTKPAVFISGTTSTDVNKGTPLSGVLVATARMRMSNVKRVCLVGEVYNLWMYMYGGATSKSWIRPCVSVFYLRMRVC